MAELPQKLRVGSGVTLALPPSQWLALRKLLFW